MGVEILQVHALFKLSIYYFEVTKSNIFCMLRCEICKFDKLAK